MLQLLVVCIVITKEEKCCCTVRVRITLAPRIMVEINEREQADLHSCVIAESAHLVESLKEQIHALKEENQENQGQIHALKEQIRALTQSRSSSTDLHH